MDLNTFRKKLSYEISEFEKYLKLDISEFSANMIQLHGYCIAALMRKMIPAVPDYNNRTIPVFEEYDRSTYSHNTITLKKILNSTIHYLKFEKSYSTQYSNRVGDGSGDFDYITIVSDHDINNLNLSIREIKTSDFIDIAKEIAYDNMSVLKALINYAINHLKSDIIQTNKKILSDINRNVKIHICLLDIFEIIDNTDSYKIPSGKISVFINVSQSIRKTYKRITSVRYKSIAVKSEKIRVEYSDIIKKLNNRNRGLRFMCGYKYYGYMKKYRYKLNTELQGKKLISLNDPIKYFQIEKKEGYNYRIVSIAEEVVEMLKQLKMAL